MHIQHYLFCSLGSVQIHWKRTEDLGKFRLKLEVRTYYICMLEPQSGVCGVVCVLCVMQEGKVKLGECCKAWVLTTQAKIRVTQLLQQYRVAKAKMDSAEVNQMK